MSAVPAEIPSSPTRTTGELIARLFEIREEKREMSTREKVLNEEAEPLEAELLTRMDDQGSTRLATTRGSATVSETVIPQVIDWDAFNAYIIENNALHFLQRRVNAAPYNELLAAGIQVPGTVPFTKRSVNLRASR